jgi:hypothetical protein
MKTVLLSIMLTGLGYHVFGGEVTVTLTTESDRILADEYSDKTKLAISNGTDVAIRIVGKAYEAQNCQWFFATCPEHIMHTYTHPHRNPHTRGLNFINSSNLLLAPGQVYVWEFEDGLHPWLQVFLNAYPNVDQYDLYAQVLVGTNQWVHSNTNTVRISRQNWKDGIVRFTGTYRRNQAFNVYEHTIDGDRLLFCTLARVCKIPVGATPSFEVETGTDILKVTFSDNSPSVRFNIWEGKVIP